MTSAIAPAPVGRAMLAAFAILLTASAAWTTSRLHLASELRQEIAALTATVIAMERRLGSYHAAGTAMGPPEDAYLEGDTQAIAAANLQKRVAGAIRQAGGRLVESGRDQNAAAAGEEEAIYLRVAFTGENAAMQRALFDIESGRPWLVVRSLVVVPIAGESELRAQMLVGAQWRNPQ